MALGYNDACFSLSLTLINGYGGGGGGSNDGGGDGSGCGAEQSGDCHWVVPGKQPWRSAAIFPRVTFTNIVSVTDK